MYNDVELVAKSKAGDLHAFEELVCRYERKIYTLAYRMTGNYHDANDLAQEAFLRAFQSIKGFRGDASFSTWLCRIATNVCRDELRKRYRVSLESLEQEVSFGDWEMKKQIPADVPGPAEIYEQQELQHELQDLINTLTPEFRMALILRDIQGLSYEEIAEQLECSLGTVKSRISRARNYLKEKILSAQEQNSQREQKSPEERLSI
ncbi:MAG TPA: sigma-70 family RNA polymerase sigma factor [Peptococcaceae bacterium]|nr:sigma-70 family RNA polymerase sigma factor [Clostridia bacterium]HOB82552.1 sigma-70 family RNA polymerase sigma factor [Peptococcaceae bacterium]HPZ70892.1 sigma-70 family RNA polymerase sigma factor [Peptococcaceae bacterium]HQD54512.1 sigma-70 family RNA polymerase sigma factor [Peptococcaceae bacterium]